jgi:hypothetical protein
MEEAVKELAEISELLAQVSARIRQIININVGDTKEDWFDQELNELQKEFETTTDMERKVSITTQKKKLLERRRIRDGNEPNGIYSVMN